MSYKQGVDEGRAMMGLPPKYSDPNYKTLGEEKYREIARMGFALWWEAKQFEVFRNLKCPQ